MKKIILIIFLFVFTGCYNYQEVNNLAIVSSFSIDYIDDDYVIILEVQENNKDNKYASYLLKGKGKSLESALQNSSIPFNKELYFMNLNVLMLTTEVASLRLDNIINFIIRDNNFSFDYNVVICDNPVDAFEIITKEEEIFGKYAKKLFNKTTNNNLNIKINDLLQSHLNKYKDIILPVFEVKDDFLVLENAAIYDEDEIIDYLTQEEIAIYNVLINAPINFHLNKESFLFKTNDYHTKLYYYNKTIYIKINLEGTFLKQELDQLDNKNSVQTYKDELTNELENDITNFLNKLKNNNSDILGLKKIIYNMNLETSSSIKNLKFKLNTEVNINNKFLTPENIGDDNWKE